MKDLLIKSVFEISSEKVKKSVFENHRALVLKGLIKNVYQQSNAARNSKEP